MCYIWLCVVIFLEIFFLLLASYFCHLLCMFQFLSLTFSSFYINLFKMCTPLYNSLLFFSSQLAFKFLFPFTVCVEIGLTCSFCLFDVCHLYLALRYLDAPFFFLSRFRVTFYFVILFDSNHVISLVWQSSTDVKGCRDICLHRVY